MATLYAKVEEYVRDGISTGRWKPGDVLPKEIELCALFKVSRPTVRTAMTHLTQEGMIQRIRHKGTIVREWRTLESATVFIESFQREMASKGLDVVTEVQEFRCVEAPEKAREQMRLPEGARAVKLMRLRYARNSFEKGPVVLTTSYLNESIWPDIQGCDMERQTLHDVLARFGCERTVLEKEITLHVLTDREARQLGELPGTTALEIDSTAWGQSGTVVEYCESVYPANRNRFLLRIHK